MSTRRRIYLLRHAEVAYLDEDSHPVAPDEAPLPRPAATRPNGPAPPWPACTAG